MSDCLIKLEVGKYYYNRAGAVIGPMELNSGSSIFAYRCDGLSYRENGWWDSGKDRDDLIGEAPDPQVEQVEQVEPAPQVEEANDPVNNPSHYASGAVECIDAIQASMSVEAFRGYCKGNVEKYVWRYETKGGVESLRKAEWYLKRLISTFDADA